MSPCCWWPSRSQPRRRCLSHNRVEGAAAAAVVGAVRLVAVQQAAPEARRAAAPRLAELQADHRRVVRQEEQATTLPGSRTRRRVRPRRVFRRPLRRGHGNGRWNYATPIRHLHLSRRLATIVVAPTTYAAMPGAIPTLRGCRAAPMTIAEIPTSFQRGEAQDRVLRGKRWQSARPRGTLKHICRRRRGTTRAGGQ